MEITTDNTKPILPKLQNHKVLVGDSVKLSSDETFDPDGDDLTYNWELSSKPNGSQAKISDYLSPQANIQTDQKGRYLIKLSVDDGQSEIQSQTSQIYAVDNRQVFNRSIGCVLDLIFYGGFEDELANSKPIADVGDDMMGLLGQNISLDGSASYDIDLDDLTYQWSLLSSPQNSMTIIDNPESQMASLTPDLEGNYVAQLMVNDGCLDSDPDSALVTITVNQAPVINSTPITQIFESFLYTYQVVATDADGHDLTYALTTAPVGMSIDTSGLITWQTTSASENSIEITVTDEFNASVTQSYNLSVLVNQAPVINSTPNLNAVVSEDYVYQINASDAENHTISYQLSTAPNGMTIDNNGLILWNIMTQGDFPVSIINMQDTHL